MTHGRTPPPQSAGVVRLRRISLTTANPARAEQFYHDGLGFESVGEKSVDAGEYARLMGIDGICTHVIVMRLGCQEIELVAFDPPGLPYPAESSSADLWFQHFAIVVSDMERAYQTIARQPGFVPISRGGPQTLPPSSGAVTAFKFRDPDGHPLELLEFPPDNRPVAWQNNGPAVFLGIDHSAIVVSDARRSLDFYVRLLGLSLTSRSLNQGPEQERLDDLRGPVVDVLGLAPSREPTPHLELLGYRAPSIAPQPLVPLRSNDVVTTRSVLEVADLAGIADALGRAGVVPVSRSPVRLGGREEAILVRDPDGHNVVLEGPTTSSPFGVVQAPGSL